MPPAATFIPPLMSRAISPLSPKYFMSDHLYVELNFIMEFWKEKPLHFNKTWEDPVLGAASENLAIFKPRNLDDRMDETLNKNVNNCMYVLRRQIWGNLNFKAWSSFAYLRGDQSLLTSGWVSLTMNLNAFFETCLV